MIEQALHILYNIDKPGHDSEILNKLKAKRLIRQSHDRSFKLTSYGRGVLQEVRKAGTKAMLNKLESYLL